MKCDWLRYLLEPAVSNVSITTSMTIILYYLSCPADVLLLAKGFARVLCLVHQCQAADTEAEDSVEQSDAEVPEHIAQLRFLSWPLCQIWFYARTSC